MKPILLSHWLQRLYPGTVPIVILISVYCCITFGTLSKEPGFKYHEAVSSLRSAFTIAAVITTAILLPLERAWGATYYVSSGIGSDSNTSTQAQSKTTPWAHAPGMANCTSACKSYTPVPGDQFILRGGDTWTSASFTWTISWSGSSGAPIYFGVDQTWYTGSSWARPIWDMQGSALGGPNIVFQGANTAYITIDNFEVINFFWNRATQVYGDDVIFGFLGSAVSNITIDHVYVHRWSHGSNGNNCTYSSGVQCDNLMVVQASGQAVGPYFSPCEYNCVLENSIIACPVGDGSCDGASGNAVNSAWGIVRNNVIHDMSNGIVGVNYQFHDNLIYNINASYDGYSHCNAYEGWSTLNDTTPQYIYNNVMHDIGTGCYGYGLYGDDAASSDARTTYLFDNVSWNIKTGHGPVESDAVGNNQLEYIYNNTFFSNTGSQPCYHLSTNGGGGILNTLDWRGNFCITDYSPALKLDATPMHLTQIPTSLMGTANAATAGYSVSQTYPGTSSPNCNGVSAAKGCPIGQGIDFTSTSPGCSTTSTNSGSMASLCNSTTGGVAISNNSQLISMGLATPRGNNWDSGAYQLGTQPPTNVVLTVK